MSKFNNTELDIIDARIDAFEKAMNAITELQSTVPMVADVGSTAAALRDAKWSIMTEIEDLVEAKQELINDE